MKFNKISRLDIVWLFKQMTESYRLLVVKLAVGKRKKKKEKKKKRLGCQTKAALI